MLTSMTDPSSCQQRVLQILSRLEAILDVENREIGQNAEFDIRASNAAKSRCLYELANLSRDLAITALPPSLAERLDAIKNKLAINARKVSANLEAVRSIAEMLKEAVEAAEADGTYSAEQFRMQASS